MREATATGPTLSKDELRARIGKLERANANLRANNKTLKRAAGEAADRIVALERYVSRLERKGRRPGRRSEENRKQPDRDPGDAVPSGVAVRSPEPLNQEDQQVLEHLNEELGPQ